MAVFAGCGLLARDDADSKMWMLIEENRRLEPNGPAAYRFTYHRSREALIRSDVEVRVRGERIDAVGAGNGLTGVNDVFTIEGLGPPWACHR